MKKQLFTMCALLSAALLTACGTETAPQNAVTAPVTEDAPVTVEAVTEDTIKPTVEAVDAGGIEYHILSRVCGEYTFPYSETIAEKESGETINDAVYKRNLAISEKYNIKVAGTENNDITGITSRMIKAGDSDYDLVLPMTSDAFAAAVAGNFYEIHDVPYIDLEKPYWQSKMIDAMSIGGLCYLLPNDMNFSILDAVGTVYFNKPIALQEDIPDLYTTVKKGEWTYAKMAEYCRLITRDIDGDGVLGLNDQYGLDCSSFAWQPLYYGTDSMLINKDKDDLPVLSWADEKNADRITSIINMLNDESQTILINRYSAQVSNLGDETVKIFKEDRALFWIEVMYGVPQLRSMNSDFGLLPMPKFDENQENYASYVHLNHSSSTCIPITNTDLDLTGRILEDMAYESYRTIRPAFYDVMLKGKGTRDNESGEMLDIIYSNINIDLTLVMNRSGLTIDDTLRDLINKNNTNLISTFEKKTAANESKIQKNVESILTLHNS